MITVNGAHIFVRNGRPFWKAGKILKEKIAYSLKSDLPTLDEYSTSKGMSELSLGKRAKSYLFDHYANKAVNSPKAFPGARFLVMTKTGLREVANRINADKAKLLPHLIQLFESARLDHKSPPDGHHTDVDHFEYAVGIFEVGGKTMRVELTAAIMRQGYEPQSKFHEIAKADPIQPTHKIKEVSPHTAVSRIRCGRETPLQNDSIPQHQIAILDRIEVSVLS